MLSESIAVTGGDRYERVDQVRLYVIPNTMEWGVCQKDFWGLFSDGAEVLYFGACNLQNPGAECDWIEECGC